LVLKVHSKPTKKPQILLAKFQQITNLQKTDAIWFVLTEKNQYQVALQGQVVETGVAFIITMDYNKFRELFHRTEEEKRMIKETRKREKELREKQKEKERLAKEKEENETENEN